MSDDYNDILQTAWEDIPEIVPLPEGSWRLRLRNASFKAPSSAESNPFFLFVYEPVEPMDDVDEDQLAELGDGYNYRDNRIFYRKFYETAADMDAVRKHLAKHGTDLGANMGEGLKNAKGGEVIAYLKQRSFTNSAGESVTENQITDVSEVE